MRLRVGRKLLQKNRNSFIRCFFDLVFKLMLTLVALQFYAYFKFQFLNSHQLHEICCLVLIIPDKITTLLFLSNLLQVHR